MRIKTKAPQKCEIQVLPPLVVLKKQSHFNDDCKLRSKCLQSRIFLGEASESRTEHGLSFSDMLKKLLVLKWNVLNAIKKSKNTNKNNKEHFSRKEKQLWRTLLQLLI